MRFYLSTSEEVFNDSDESYKDAISAILKSLTRSESFEFTFEQTTGESYVNDESGHRDRSLTTRLNDFIFNIRCFQCNCFLHNEKFQRTKIRFKDIT